MRDVIEPDKIPHMSRGAVLLAAACACAAQQELPYFITYRFNAGLNNQIFAWQKLACFAQKALGSSARLIEQPLLSSHVPSQDEAWTNAAMARRFWALRPANESMAGFFQLSPWATTANALGRSDLESVQAMQLPNEVGFLHGCTHIRGTEAPAAEAFASHALQSRAAPNTSYRCAYVTEAYYLDDRCDSEVATLMTTDDH